MVYLGAWRRDTPLQTGIPQSLGVAICLPARREFFLPARTFVTLLQQRTYLLCFLLCTLVLLGTCADISSESSISLLEKVQQRNKVENILTFWRLASFSFPFFSSPKLTFGLTTEKPRALKPCLTKTSPCSRKISNKVSRLQQNKIKFLFNYLLCFEVKLGSKNYVLIMWLFMYVFVFLPFVRACF